MSKGLSSKLLNKVFFTIIIGLLIGWTTGVIDICSVKIKGEQIKISILSLDWHYRDNDVFTWDIVNRIEYEDAMFALLPDYDGVLRQDLDLIASNRQIDLIDPEQLTILNDNIVISICLEEKNIEFHKKGWWQESALVDIKGYLELYDSADGTLLYSNPNRKFHIDDEILFEGFGSRSFKEIKVSEIYYSQISTLSNNILREFQNSF